MTDAARGEQARVGEVTGLLRRWASGEMEVQDSLFDSIYPELRKLAAQRLRRGPLDLSIQATELVNEAFLRLVDQRVSDWRCRAQFFAIASMVLRRVLVDLAKHRFRKKRIPPGDLLPLDDADLVISPPDVDLIALDEALDELSKFQAVAARVVELRFFAGLSIEEAAALLNLGPASIGRKWRFARAWLARRLGVEA